MNTTFAFYLFVWLVCAYRLQIARSRIQRIAAIVGLVGLPFFMVLEVLP